ncbi:MAG: beta-ketoacyl-[acyl-carrier-protein] synthase family protein [Planctomycetota bacterium]|nr:MAG: beta-ketoacyl-[acyl-carrier-protein] synthase family protein [Planctomycetota bacterium]
MTARKARRVVVTGMSAVSPPGNDLASTWASVKAGASGVRSVQSFDATDWPVQIAGEVRDFRVDPFLDESQRSLGEILPRNVQMGVAATAMAAEDAGLQPESIPPERLGISVGAYTTCINLRQAAGWRTLMVDHAPPRYPDDEKRIDLRLPQVSIVEALGDRWRAGGPNYVVSTACAAGTQALGSAVRAIEDGRADVMISGGFDNMVEEVVLLSFSLLGVMSQRNDEPERASRPFDRQRDGFVISEGAAILILEELKHAQQRGARIYAELTGYGASMTTEHITDAATDGGAPAAAISLALQDAGMEPEQIQYVNAHGTSTRGNDKSETMAIRKAFGEHADRLAVSSTKSMTGHLIHAAGALEAVFCVMAIHDNVAPPTINYEHPDPGCDLDYVPNEAREMPIDAALSNSFAFGGNNGAVVFRRLQE